MLEPIQTRLDEFENTSKNQEIVNRGHISAEKIDTNTRILVMNANSFRCTHEEKIDDRILQKQ